MILSRLARAGRGAARSMSTTDQSLRVLGQESLVSGSMHAPHVAIFGAGFVGVNTALSLLQRNIASVVSLTDIDEEKCLGEVLDLEDAGAPGAIYKASAEAAGQADVIIITAGRGQLPGETRLELIQGNAKIMASIVASMQPINPEAKIIVVANPCDPLTWQCAQLAGLPDGAVFGSGTVLDSMRLRVELAHHLNVHAHDVHVNVLGEHGDSQFAAYSTGNIGGRPLLEFPGVADLDLGALEASIARKAYEIIDRKKYTAYGVANATATIVDAVINDRKSILPVSVMAPKVRVDRNCCLAVPSVVGVHGIEKVLDIYPHLSPEEAKKYDA
eukprot:CAMPEP_0119283408 /NCGR_PEP_ID=MMETSP1329-20130426/28438_1 /TAXON_ID=114041 /ORGANISM="Genus nov. species nov., Strain RCC1024" /LENGTH=329 /DNA_ID=CAMNT_0007284079 /DNA_START=127 /DNA_END=1113 /DNA_ORIENTATION=+